MKYTILKNRKCWHVNGENFEGAYDYVDMDSLSYTLIQKSTLEKEDDIAKDDLPMFCCTSFSSRIKMECAQPTSLYGFDFDEDSRIDTALSVFKDYNFFLYSSYRHTEEQNKFRVIVELDMTVHDNNESHILFGVMKRRLEKKNLLLDKVCKDITRRFYLPAYGINNQFPVLEHNTSGRKFDVKHDFQAACAMAAVRKQAKDSLHSLQSTIRKRNPQSQKIKCNIEKKILAAKDDFLANPSNKSLGRLISSLKFWAVDDADITDWVYQNYNPTTGNLRNEVKGWMNTCAGTQTYKEKYGL